eukprot:CAMPEP_0198154774 /NCGR_PEP_ID=MMETSP1443-20131203/68781_1 /TAXON_ID=186043 /ORGANISM="Entomoneis sp., Strain CCMP2396" /LENGTH=170 /DNA_ID=CAMNT_0043821481 /DNA_START=25 /DNA_END=537 /DNA_ORIENTATION=+
MVRFSSILCYSVFLAQQADAFSCGSMNARPSTTSLSLTPEQSSDLVKASNEIYQQYISDEATRGDDYADQEDQVRTIAVLPTVKSQRSFVSRLFSLPSSLWHPSTAEGFLHDEVGHYEEVDVVYFPVVGFTYALDSPEHCRPLPTVSNPSCRLHNDEEPLVGWFHRPKSP